MNLTLGATCSGANRCHFVVWAPRAKTVDVRIFNDAEAGAVTASDFPGRPVSDRVVRLQVQGHGYHAGIVTDVAPGARYVYRLDARTERPDPASSFQPEGVHGPSQVIDLRAFRWNDAGWRGLPLNAYIIYELHVGTYTSEGTFDAIIPYLDEIANLGVTALELMPVAQFPGNRNWGYDGAYPFAVQNTYGGPEGLRRLVNACHQRKLGVVLDVVYNHLGPEGNYLGDYGPYFTDRYRSPWGEALNFDGPESDEVVHYFVQNALQWVRDFRLDALRLDAIHGIVDSNAQPFLRLLSEAVHEFARQADREIHLIAESDLNDVRYIQPAESGGYGMDSQWSDDFHHALHALLTKETSGYYLDFGRMADMAKAIKDGFVYSGQYSRHRLQRHGSSSRNFAPQQFVVCSQNHDQVGNRMLGERLGSLVSFEALKLAAATVILSPYLPLLFMGEEWGETAPFPYFISHSDDALVEAVRRGRQEEFAAFSWRGHPPDPQSEATFVASKLNHTVKHTEPHRTLLELYRVLIDLRCSLPAFEKLSKEQIEVKFSEADKSLEVRRWNGNDEVLMIANFSEEPKTVILPEGTGSWNLRLDTASQRWSGPNKASMYIVNPAGIQISIGPTSACLFQRKR